MAREHVVELFLGITADPPTREAARARLMWLGERLHGPRILCAAPASPELGILLARPPLEVTAVVSEAQLAEAAALLADQDERIRARVVYTTSRPAIPADTLISGAAPDLGALREGGRLLLTCPIGQLTPTRAAALLHDRVAPEELLIRAGWLCFSGRRHEHAAEAWDMYLASDALTRVAEEGALELAAFYESRLEDLEASRRALIAAGARRGRQIERAMRAAIEQNVRLREQVERTRRSARYQLGSAFVSAARPSREMLKLPGRLLEIYRAKTAGRIAEPAQVLEEPAEHEPRRRLLEERFDKFAHEARAASAPWIAVLYTGTRIDGIRANRPYALARVLRERGVPVLFGYHGTVAGGDVPPYADPLFLELPEELLSAKLEKIAALEVGSKKKLFLIAYPMPAAARALNDFNARGWVTIYDALDDWEEFARANVSSWFSGSVEKYIVANADLTAAVSRPLAAKLAAYTDAPKLLVSPNALDPAFVHPEYSRNPASPAKIGYFGHLTPAWFDWSALAMIAKTRPDLRFEIIGYGAPAELDLPPNIRLLGPKDRAEICEIAEEWSAAIIPFKIGPLADAVDPIKVYEYLALGLPAVSFRMPQIADYPATATAETIDEFIAALDRALEKAPDRAEIAEFLAKNTWKDRLDALLEAGEKILERAPFEKNLMKAGAA